MKYNYLIAILLFFGCYALSSCQKELTCYGTECPGISIYLFVQNNDVCSDALINGTYRQGTALTDGNTVAVKVNVTKKGAYTINSDTLNGFYFKGEGEFANTGVLTVLLMGIGKPAAAGNYTFIINKTSGCSFTVRVDTIPYVEKYFYDFTLDGIKYTDTVRGGVRMKSFEFIGSKIALSSNIGYGSRVVHQNGAPSNDGFFVFKGYISSSLNNLAGLQNFFAVGNYNFSNRFSSSDGVLVGWVDLNAPSFYWNTGLGTQPAASNFIITNIETYADAIGRPIAKVKATFNCILYNERGESKVLTNGKYYGEFANILR